MLNSEVLLPVVRHRLVERCVLLLADLLRVARPKRLRLVKLLVRDRLLLDLLGLLLLLGLLVDLLDLGLAILVLLLLLCLVILNILARTSTDGFGQIEAMLTFSTSLVTASWMG